MEEIMQYQSTESRANIEASFESQIILYRKDIYRFILSKVKDRELADDLFQDTAIRLLESMRKGTYHENGKFKSWAFKTAYHIVMDHFRSQSRKLNHFEKLKMVCASESMANMPEDTFKIHRTEKKRYKAIIGKLSRPQKEVVLLRIYYDCSFREIAEITGVSINTALGRMRYASQHLRVLMQEAKLG